MPETAGVVAGRELVGADLHFAFEDGRTFVIPLAARTIGVQPDVGTLLLSGTSPELWLKSIPPKPISPGDPIPAGCFRVEGAARADATKVYLHVEDARGAIEFALPKAADWTDPQRRAGSDQLVGNATCVNARGAATLRY